MRLKHWLSTFLGSSLLVVSGIAAQAQPPGMPAPMGGPPSGNVMMPVDAYGAAPAPTYGYGPPAGYQTWPEMSAFDHSYSQQSVDANGTWTDNTNNAQRRYRLDVDYITGTTRVSKAFIGNQSAMTYIQVLQEQLGTQNQGGGGGGNQQQNGQTFLTAYSEQLNANGTPVLGQPPHFELYGPVRLQSLDRKFHTDGTRASWGYDNPDESGLRLGFLYNTDNNFRYDKRDKFPAGKGGQSALLNHLLQLPEDPADPNTVLPRDLSQLSQYVYPASAQQALQNNLFNLNGLPLNDGTLKVLPDGTHFGGVTAPYDLDFQINLQTQLYGGNIDWVMTPVLDWKYIKVRPVAGLRYYNLNEKFGFYGRDSGLAYGPSQGAGGGGGGNNTLIPDQKVHSTPDGIDNDQDGIIDNAGVFEGSGQGQQGGGGNNQNGGATFLQFHDQFRYPITSYLNNNAVSNLAGAMVGLNYDIGGESLLLTGSTQFGLLANNERIKINGDNIAMHTRESNLLLPSPTNATPNAFSGSQTHNRVSPLFQQSINFEAPLFRYVPVLKRVGILEHAKFRAGYTFMFIGGVVDTADSIQWNGNPSAGLFPSIKVNRYNYTSDFYNFGVSWEF